MINQNWIFGKSAGLDFFSNPPSATTGNAISTIEGCASVSDANGSLLFYTDGISIWDGSHTQRYTGLKGNSSSTQSSIIVPDPANSDQYYVLTMNGATHYSPPYFHLNGVLINITLPNWVVIPDLSTLPGWPSTTGFSPCERLAAVQHTNCRDFWVVTVLQEGADGSSFSTAVKEAPGIFRVFLIDSSGIHFYQDLPMGLKVNELGYLRINPTGDKLALANGEKVLVYDFNNSTGLISIGSLKQIQLPNSPSGINPFTYGVEFSPNGRFLYYANLSVSSTANPGYVFQVDLGVPNPSSTLVGTFPNTNQNRYAIGALQLGIDGRIYIAQDGESFLGAILAPNVAGQNCNVTPNFISLPRGASCFLGLPNLLPNPCPQDDPCSCTGCNDDANAQNEELADRAGDKFNVIKSSSNCDDPFTANCHSQAIDPLSNFEPCFYFHWGDGANDQIEEHDTEVFYLTVCNRFSDIQYNGLRITKATLVPDVHPLEKIQIVPDRFISFDCLESCSCKTREFAIITRGNNISGTYSLEVEYCFDNISFKPAATSGKVDFEVVITDD